MDTTISILLVEDNQADARLVDIYLNECTGLSYGLKHIVRIAEAETLRRSGYQPNVILLDMSLPDSSGLESIEKIAAIFGNESAIIVLTGMDDQTMGLKAVQASAQDYLEKDSLNPTILQRSILYAAERKRLQAQIEKTANELRRSEDYLLQAQNIAKMGSYELLLSTRQMYWSGPVYALLQCEYKAKPTLDDYLACMPDMDRPKVESTLHQSQLKKGQHVMVEHRIISPDQLNTSYIIMQGEVVETAEKQLKIIGTIQDVTDHKYAKELLLQSEERYRTIFEQSQDSIFIVANNGKFIEFNKPVLQLIGYTADELRYININQLYTDLSLARLCEKQLAANGKVKDFELQLRRKDGTIIDCLLNAALWYSIDGSIRGFHGIIRDITTQKRAQGLVKAKEVAEQSAKMREQFLANMSHEIRTPMNVVIGMTHLLENTRLNEKQKEYLTALKVSSDNLLKLINSVLDLSKIESGKLELEKHSFSLNALVKELLQTYRFKAREKGINLFNQMDADIPETIIGDSVRLHQILSNLISNAIKYTDKGEVLLKCELIDENDYHCNIKFSVCDTGIGIAPDKHQRIFDTFVQAGEETTRLFGGTGLGLSIVRKLIELHQSTIHIDSDIGRGAIFSFTIQFDRRHADSYPSNRIELSTHNYQQLNANRENANPPTIQRRTENLSILLVEDHQLNQIVATDLLKKWSPTAQIDIAGNGQEAIIALRKKNYDVVLMDISMPVMDGYEATEYIRKEMPPPAQHVPIIAMTAHAFDKNAERCFEVGMNEFVSKPINPTILYNKLAHTLANIPAATDQSIAANNDTLSDDKTEAKTNRLINLDYLESLTGGDDEIKQIMLETLVQDLPGEIIQLETDAQNEQWNALKASAHKLKSTCAYMGLEDSVELARVIEKNAWEETDLLDIPELVQQLAHNCRLAHTELQEELRQIVTLTK
ncbi:MAG: response regulator [Chitinophagales bacterium]|nr:response regulator [Chitinophagales bacterium]